MSAHTLIKSYGELKMYRTSSGRYSIDYEEKCVRSNLGPDDAYYFWDNLVKRYGSKILESERGAEQLSFGRTPLRESSISPSLDFGYNLGSGENRIPTHILSPMEGAFKKKDKSVPDILREREHLRLISRPRRSGIYEEM
jgi:hypothetical protein